MLTIAELEQKIAKRKAAAKLHAEIMATQLLAMYHAKLSVFHALRGLDLKVDEPTDWCLSDVYDYTVEVPREKLQLIRRTLDSRMEMAGKEVKDPVEKLIWVSLSLEKFPGVKLKFAAELKETDQCEMKEVHYPASSSMQLVCKVIPKPN